MLYFLGSVDDLLSIEPDLHVPGEVLCHRLPPEVQGGVYGLPGQEGGGAHLAHCCLPCSAQEPDTGLSITLWANSHVYESTLSVIEMFKIL